MKIGLETRFSAVRYAHHTANITMQSCQYLSPSGRCRIDGRTFTLHRGAEERPAGNGIPTFRWRP